MKTLPGYPSQPQHTIAVEVDGAAYRLRLTWRAVPAAWYVDLLDVDGAELVTGRRMSAGWSPFAGLVVEGGPGGLFYVRGADDYDRDALGATLTLVHIGDADLAALDAPVVRGFTLVPVGA